MGNEEVNINSMTTPVGTGIVPVEILKTVETLPYFINFVMEANGKQNEVVVCRTRAHETTIIQKADFEESLHPTKEVSPSPKHPYQIVIPLQPEASCSASCTFCIYGQTEKGMAFSSPEVLVSLVRKAMDEIMRRELIDSESEIKLSLLKGGDPSLMGSKKLKEILGGMHNKFPQNPIKLSSIVAKNRNFLETLLDFRVENENAQILLQISVNSTDDGQRTSIVNGGKREKIKLYSLEELAEFSENWTEQTGRRPTLTFTLTSETIFEPQKIAEIFDPKCVVIRMRQMHSNPGDLYPMSEAEYKVKYFELHKLGFTDTMVANASKTERDKDLVQGVGLRLLS